METLPGPSAENGLKRAVRYVGKSLRELVAFMKNVANDSRIPKRDKTILLTLIALIVSPLDLVPDWIPFLGQLDDLMMGALVLDYFFRVLDPEILLSHYPWGLKSFARLKRAATLITCLAPDAIRKRIWQYTGDPYRAERK